LTTTDPVLQQLNRDVTRIIGTMPRAIAHSMRDVLEKAWLAGYEAGKK